MNLTYSQALLAINREEKLLYLHRVTPGSRPENSKNNMSIIAKFFISEKTKTKISSDNGQPVFGWKIKGYPVYQGDEENKKFFASSPSGTLELATINKAAADQVEPGDEVYITITKAEKIAG